jgi:hypothetical protein
MLEPSPPVTWERANVAPELLSIGRIRAVRKTRGWVTLDFRGKVLTSRHHEIDLHVAS